MKRHPPRATRTYTRFPSTTHFLSKIVDDAWQIIILSECAQRRSQPHTVPAELYNLGVACGAGPEQELATVGEAREAADAPETARIRSALAARSEEHTSELQSLMRISYAVFCLKQKKNDTQKHASATNTTPRTVYTTHL